MSVEHVEGLADSRVLGVQVIICTDGLSNVGLGGLSSNPSKDEKAYAKVRRCVCGLVLG